MTSRGPKNNLQEIRLRDTTLQFTPIQSLQPSPRKSGKFKPAMPKTPIRTSKIPIYTSTPMSREMPEITSSPEYVTVSSSSDSSPDGPTKRKSLDATHGSLVVSKRPKLDSSTNKENLSVVDRKGKGRARVYTSAREKTPTRMLSNLTSASRLTHHRYNSHVYQDTEHTFTFDYSYITRSTDRELNLNLASNTALRSKVLKWISSDDGDNYDMKTLADIDSLLKDRISFMDAITASRRSGRRSPTRFSSTQDLLENEDNPTCLVSSQYSTQIPTTDQPNTSSETGLQTEEMDSAMITGDNLCRSCSLDACVQNQQTDSAVVTDSGDSSTEIYSDSVDALPEAAMTEARENQHELPPLTSTQTSVADLRKTDYYDEIIQKLRDVFGHRSFLENQLEAITATMSGQDVFLILATGSGKSLCFQLPAVCKSGTTKGITFVVSPLIALMNDQARELEAKNIDVVLLTSNQNSTDITDLEMAILCGERKPSLVYVTPEKLQASIAMKKLLRTLYDIDMLARFAIDEAHCVPMWGRTFREAFSDLSSLRENFPKVPIIAVTATATIRMQDEIINCLGIKNCVRLQGSFNRPNLNYEIRPKKHRGNVVDMAQFIKKNHAGHTGIIYCSFRQRCEELAKELRDHHGLNAKHFHSALTSDDKERTRSAWSSGECHIIVATIAFGMGISCDNGMFEFHHNAVRFVIHYSIPDSLLGYYQETGRAGRDGQPADCLLYYCFKDAASIIHKFKGNKELDEDSRQKMIEDMNCMVDFCRNEVECRRTQIMHHFGEVFDSRLCNELCDVCRDTSEIQEEDIRAIAVKAIELAKSMCHHISGSITKTQFSETFQGRNCQAIRSKGFDKLLLFGAGKDFHNIERLVEELLVRGVFRLVDCNNGGLFPNYKMNVAAKAKEFIESGEGLVMRFRKGNPRRALISVTETFDEKSPSPTFSTIMPSSRVLRNRDKPPQFYEEPIPQFLSDDDIPEPSSDDDFPEPSSSRRTLDHSKHHYSPEFIEDVESDDDLDIVFVKSNRADEKDANQKCFDELWRIRGEIAKTYDIHPEEVLSELCLQMLSATLPSDVASLDLLLNQNDVNPDKLLGRKRFLNACINHRVLIKGKSPLIPTFRK